MKKAFFTALTFLTIKSITAQNTFPSSGSVGIGTTTPAYTLDVIGTARVAGITYNASNQFQVIAGNAMMTVGNENILIQANNFGSINFTTANQLLSRLYIGNNGNIGMGTEAPETKLHVLGDIKATNLKLGALQGIEATCLSTHIYNACGSAGYITFGFGATTNAQTYTPDPLTIQQSNNAIGVRNNNPTEALDVTGNIKATGLIIPSNAAAGKVLTSDANGNATWQTASGGSGSSHWTPSGNNVLSSIIGFVGIGTSASFIGADANLKLAVNGNIHAKKLRITQNDWADYVFRKNYDLLPLNELEKYIQENNHLPEIPSAAEVEKNGIDVGENQVLLLKKIEELTLYILEQNKRIEKLEKGIKQGL